MDRRRKILEAALDAFAEHGFEGATTTQIAARAGATQGLIYFYFPKGKEELFAAAFAQQADQSFGTLDLGPLLASDATPETVLKHAIARIVDVLGSAPCQSMTRVLWRTMANADGSGPSAEGGDRLSETRRCGLAHVQRLVGQIRDYLAAQAAQGELQVDDPGVTARLIVGGMLMALRMAGAEEMAEDRRAALAERVAMVYIHGLLPKDTRAGRPPRAVKR
jgi:AcrR family transcriptional regulator